MLPMPSEKLKLIVNYLSPKDIASEYNEAKEDERRAVAHSLPSPSKFIPFRALRLKYIEVDYNFYGMCSELYSAVAEAIHQDPLDIDLFVYSNDDEAISVSS